MTAVAVLDAAAFDTIDAPQGGVLRQLLREVVIRGGAVRCAAVTLAEVCRGSARTRRAEAAVARLRGGQRIAIVPTDERLAKLVGAILHSTGSASDRLADAHVIAVAADAEVAIVISADPTDMLMLAAAVPGTRVVVRRPEAILAAGPS